MILDDVIHGSHALLFTCVHMVHTPGEVKKVLNSFLSVVTSLISEITSISLPTTGGIRWKPRILRVRVRDL